MLLSEKKNLLLDDFQALQIGMKSGRSFQEKTNLKKNQTSVEVFSEITAYIVKKQPQEGQPTCSYN